MFEFDPDARFQADRKVAMVFDGWGYIPLVVQPSTDRAELLPVADGKYPVKAQLAAPPPLSPHDLSDGTGSFAVGRPDLRANDVEHGGTKLEALFLAAAGRWSPDRGAENSSAMRVALSFRYFRPQAR